jgi:hypothetical protein
LSFELSDLCRMVELHQKNPSYDQLFRNLGPSILRFSGNSEDYTLWEPGGVASCSDARTVLTRPLVDEVFSFLKSIGWKVVWGINFLANDPERYADEAAYIAQVGRSELLAFAIGNEPELYTRNGRKSPGWSYRDYLQEWTAYYSAIKKRVPDAQFEGPDTTCCQNEWDQYFLADMKVTLGADIIAAAHHHYPTRKVASANSDRAATAENLLSAPLHQRVATSISLWKKNADMYRVPLVLSEVNSASGGGKAGLSDAFAATLWGSDYAFTALALGVSRMNFHGSYGPVYSPISFATGQPAPLYYSMLFFVYAVQHATGFAALPLINGKENLTGYVIANQNGKLRVALINKGTSHALLNIRLSQDFSSAGALHLTAPSLSATQVTFGRSLTEAGKWSPGEDEPLALHQRQTSIMLSPSSASVITFQ